MRLIGTLAAICTTSSFIPQILKIWRQGGNDLSYPMLFVYLTGTLLWLAYGLLLRAPAVIWANAATAALVFVAIVLKATFTSRERISRATRSGSPEIAKPAPASE